MADWLSSLNVLGLRTLHLRSMERSAASARNRGIERVESSLVAAIDDDCVVEKDWLEKMESAAPESLGYSGAFGTSGRWDSTNRCHMPCFPHPLAVRPSEILVLSRAPTWGLRYALHDT